MDSFELRGHNYIGLADATFRIYKRHFNLFFKITAIFFLVPVFVQKIYEARLGFSLGIPGLINEAITDLMSEISPGYYHRYDMYGGQDYETACCLVAVVLVIKVILTALCACPIVNATRNILIGEKLGLREVFHIRFWSYFHSVWWTFLLIIYLAFTGFIAMVVVYGLGGVLVDSIFPVFYLDSPCYAFPCGCSGLLVPAIPVIFLGVRQCLYIPVIVLENIPGSMATQRSPNLVRGYWWLSWRVILGVVFIQSVIAGTSGFMFGLLNSLILKWNPGLEVVCQTISAVGLTLVHVFVFPIIFITLALLFYQIKVNKEAYDLQVMIEKF